MGLPEVYLGHKTWNQYVSGNTLAESFEQAIKAISIGEQILRSSSVSIRLSESDHYTAQESGLGALCGHTTRAEDQPARAVEISIEKIAEGLDHLHADFNAAAGDSVWKVEMRRESLRDSLQQFRLPEFEREARAFRVRAETAYINGWHEEALADFLQSEKRNYPDFAVLRSVASIYFYHLNNPSEALQYFLKAGVFRRL